MVIFRNETSVELENIKNLAKQVVCFQSQLLGIKPYQLKETSSTGNRIVWKPNESNSQTRSYDPLSVRQNEQGLADPYTDSNLKRILVQCYGQDNYKWLTLSNAANIELESGKSPELK